MLKKIHTGYTEHWKQGHSKRGMEGQSARGNTLYLLWGGQHFLPSTLAGRGNNLYYVGAEAGNKLIVCPRYDYVTDYNLRIHNSITWHWTKV